MQTKTLPFAAAFRDHLEHGVGLLILAAKNTSAPKVWREKAEALAFAGAKIMLDIEAGERFETACAVITNAGELRVAAIKFPGES